MRSEQPAEAIELAVFRQPRAERHLPRWRRPDVLTVLNAVYRQVRRRR